MFALSQSPRSRLSRSLDQATPSSSHYHHHHFCVSLFVFSHSVWWWILLFDKFRYTAPFIIFICISLIVKKTLSVRTSISFILSFQSKSNKHNTFIIAKVTFLKHHPYKCFVCLLAKNNREARVTACSLPNCKCPIPRCTIVFTPSQGHIHTKHLIGWIREVHRGAQAQ